MAQVLAANRLQPIFVVLETISCAPCEVATLPHYIDRDWRGPASWNSLNRLDETRCISVTWLRNAHIRSIVPWDLVNQRPIVAAVAPDSAARRRDPHRQKATP